MGWLLLLILGLDDTGPQWRCILRSALSWLYYVLGGTTRYQEKPSTQPTATDVVATDYDVLADAGVLMSVQLNGMAWFLQNFANYGISLVILLC